MPYLLYKDQAVEVLTPLLGLSKATSLDATQFFIEKLFEEPNSFAQLMNLRGSLDEGDNAAMMVLMNCFGISGAEAITALQAVKKLI